MKDFCVGYGRAVTPEVGSFNIFNFILRLFMEKIINKILSGDDVRDAVFSGIDSEKYLFEMENVLGEFVKTDKIDFSFFFSRKDNNPHGIRAKIKWDPSRFKGDGDGYMKLHGSYDFIKAPYAKNVDGSDIKNARKFFKKYKVLFAAVWEDVLDQNIVQKYFEGVMSFQDLLGRFDFDLSPYGIETLKDLEAVVRENKFFNMND